MPDYPHSTKWLSEEERAFAAWRLQQDVNETDASHAESVWAGTKMAFKDYRLYIFILLQHVSLLSQTFQYFFPSIVGTLNYGRIETLWLTAPVWVCCHSDEFRETITDVYSQFATFLVSVLVTYTSSKTGDRSLHIICLMVVAAIGNAIATATTSVGARFFAMFLMPLGAVSACKSTPATFVPKLAVLTTSQTRSSSPGSPTPSPAPSSSARRPSPWPT